VDRQQIADVLAAHARKHGIRDGKPHCVCGWTGVRHDLMVGHQAHLVEMLYEAQQEDTGD
jgi:hypothetical protein